MTIDFFQNVWDYRFEECGTSCVRARSVAVPPLVSDTPTFTET